MKQTLFIGMTIVAVSIVIGYGALSVLSEKRPPRPDCRPVVVQSDTIQYSIFGMGRVKPKQLIHIAAKRPGKVSAILAEKDETVTERQPLVRITPEPDFMLQLNQMRYDLYTAQLQQQTMQTHLDKQRKVYERGMVAQSVIEELERNLIKAEKLAALANERLMALAQETGQPLIASPNAKTPSEPLDIFILAPTSGTILDINKQIGDVIIPDRGTYLAKEETTVAVLADMSALFVECMVNEIDIKNVRIGQAAVIRLEAQPEKVYAGIIKKISRIATRRETIPDFMDGGLYYFTAFLEIEDPDELVRPGMTCNVQIVIREKKDVPVLPIETVFKEMDQIFVVIGSSDEFNKRIITTGISNEKQVEIASGLNAGDIVCGSPLLFLEWQEQVRQYDQRNIVERLLQ